MRSDFRRSDVCAEPQKYGLVDKMKGMASSKIRGNCTTWCARDLQ